MRRLKKSEGDSGEGKKKDEGKGGKREWGMWVTKGKGG